MHPVSVMDCVENEYLEGRHMDILVVEDDAVLGKAIQRGLQEAGHACTWVRDGAKGLELGLGQQYDAVVLDLMLPDLGGMDVLGRLRSAGIRTPVMILTALGSVEDRVTGLNSGAARPSSELRVGPLGLNLTTRRVTRADTEIDLTPTEFSLLEYLMRYAGQVVTRKMLCEHLWEADWEGVTNVIEVHINRLRSKIDRSFNEPLIQTVRGRGYVLRAN
jgi:two-component system OmpR family response regulator